MVLTVSLLIIIARQLKGMVSVSQALRRISGANGHDIISDPLKIGLCSIHTCDCTCEITKPISRFCSVRITEICAHFCDPEFYICAID